LTFKIAFKHSIERDLKQIDKSDAAAILDKIETELSINAGRYPALKGKFKGLRKYRVGQYRAVYTLANDTVLILRISHRKEAYR